MIQIDNLEELTKGLSDREYTSVWSDINNIIVDEIDGHEGFVRNFQDDMYTFAISRGALRAMEEKGFKILEKFANCLLRVRCQLRFLSVLVRT